MIRSFLSSIWTSTTAALWPYLLAGLILTNVASGLEGYHLANRHAQTAAIHAIVHANIVQHKAAATESPAHQQVVTKVETRTKIEKQYVIQHVKDLRQCDVPVDVVKLLNAANH